MSTSTGGSRLRPRHQAIEYLANVLAREAGYSGDERGVFYLIDQISNRRALGSVETDLLLAANRRQRGASLKRPWTPRDDETIRQMHPTVPQVERGWAEIGQALDPPRSPFAVKKRIFDIGLRTGRTQSSQASVGVEG